MTAAVRLFTAPTEASRLDAPRLNRRTVVRALLLSPLLAAGFACSASAATTVPAATAWVEAFTGDGLRLLKQKDATAVDQAAHFRELLRRYFAIGAIARWVLGRYWNQATAAEREQYLQLFEDFVVYGYVERFSAYSGENIRVVRGVDNPDGSVTIMSVVERPGGQQPINVGWRVSGDDTGTTRMTDVVIENVSLSQTYRSDFASALQQQGGTVAGLLGVLQQRIAAQKAQLGISE
jgi:ABC-type transport system involved in resistance to organic solvents, auxiliary component